MAGVSPDPSNWSNEALASFAKSNLNLTVPVNQATRLIIINKIKRYLHVEEDNAKLEETRVPINTNNSTKRETKEASDFFYCVYTKDNEHVSCFCSEKEAIEFSKQCMDARFKKFKTKQEAEQFKRDDLKSSQTLPVAASERPNDFKDPKQQERNALKRAIESGDVDKFNETIWSNPRFLVSNGDAPSIIFPGSYQNALHIAVAKNQLEMCKSILCILNSSHFWELLYPMDTEETRETRKSRLIDLYANRQTGRPGVMVQNQDTPLHIAAKHGFREIVQLLLSQPQVDVNIKDKDGMIASEVICTKEGDSKLKAAISKLFEDPAIYYIPVYRTEDNSTPPILGSPSTWNECTSPVPQKSPIDPCYRSSATAGPMSNKQASNFYKKWKHSKGSLQKDVRRKDSDKGLEHVGRDLAKLENVPWREYWEFLDTSVDISSSEGLSCLEKHLSTSGSSGYARPLLPMDTSGSSPTLTRSIPSSTDQKEDMSAVTDEQIKMTLMFEEDNCTLKGDDISELVSKMKDLDVDGPRENLDGRTSSVVKMDSSEPQLSQTFNSEGFKTPQLAASTPNGIFLTGDSPSKVDRDVSIALGHAPISEKQYPHVSMWKRNVASYSESERKSWHTPRVSYSGRRLPSGSASALTVSPLVYTSSPGTPQFTPSGTRPRTPSHHPTFTTPKRLLPVSKQT